MKLQHLAIIFVIIMLPISMVITYYIQSQIDSIGFQTQYDTKLQTATHDAIKAFQLNTINNKYSTVSDSKMRDIEASVSTFYNSLGTELGASGFNENELKDYIPAIVYTMQDGYYIYSKYYNDTISDYQYGLKPYIYYACRYKKGTDDFVVNYTLDNYITVYGMVDNSYVTKSGPLINPNLVTDITESSLKYNGVLIEKEILKEQLILTDDLAKNKDNVIYEYITYGNKRVYKDNETDKYFWNTNNTKQFIQDKATLNFAKKWTIGGHLYSNSAVEYYTQAYYFSLWVNQNLSEITQANAIDSKGNKITDFAVNTGDSKIFKLDNNNNPFLDDSVFNNNRIAVIRKSIESNLSAAIANFGAGADYEFVMPVFTEEDWDKLVNNVSVASFMQGIPIGAKYYNNYCIITNNKTKENVSKESIYIITNDNNDSNPLSTLNEVHKPSSRDVIDNGKTVIGAYKNVDFEMQTVVITEENECYYYPHANNRCYNCMVNVAETYNIDDIINGKIKVYDIDTNDYVETNKDISNLRKIYLTALARERYDLNRVIGDENDYTEGVSKLEKDTISIYLNPSGWTNQSVEATATSKLENVKLETSKDGVNWQETNKQTFTSNGKIYAKTTHNETGNVTEKSLNIMYIDTTPPSKTTIKAYTYDANGNEIGYTSNANAKSNVKLVFSATDEGGSGVAYYQYSHDGQNVANEYMQNPYLVSSNGEWTFYIRAVDYAGNIGPWSDKFVVIRNALEPGVPNVIYEKGSNTHSWQNNVVIKLKSESNGLEISHYEVDTNNDGITNRRIENLKDYIGTFEPENRYSSCNTRFRAVAANGNASQWTPTLYHIHIDQDPPTKPTINLNGYNQQLTTQQVIVTANATDNLSGIDYYLYTTDKSSSFNNYRMPSNPWTIKEEYNNIFYISAVDKAGNIGPWSDGFRINIYLQKPSAPKVKYVNNSVNQHKWQNNIKIKLTASDEHKAQVIYYEVDIFGNGSDIRQIPFSGEYLPEHGINTCTARFRSVDGAGMRSNWTDINTTYHIHSDRIGPELVKAQVMKGPSNVTMYITAKDEQSGVATVSCAVMQKFGDITQYSTITATKQEDGRYKMILSNKQFEGMTSIIMVDNVGNITRKSKSDITFEEIQPEIIKLIENGTVLYPEYIISNTGKIKSPHSAVDGKATTNSIDDSNKYFGASCGGMYTGGRHECSETPYVDITITLDNSLIGKECTLEGYYTYSARFHGVEGAYIKNGTEEIMKFSGNNTTKTDNKTFILNSNTIQMYIKFKCDNDVWGPSGAIGIKSLTIK